VGCSKSGDEGQTVSATWPEQVFTPVAYNSFRVGPFSASSIVRDCETIAEAIERVRAQLSVVAQRAFDEESERYLQNLASVTVRASQVRTP
jgi:hypothetical protein